MNLALILNLIDLVARVLVALDNYRAKLEGEKEANDAANSVQLARIKAALAARDAVPAPGVHDPDQRD